MPQNPSKPVIFCKNIMISISLSTYSLNYYENKILNQVIQRSIAASLRIPKTENAVKKIV
jgi:hypothetical protein